MVRVYIYSFLFLISINGFSQPTTMWQLLTDGTIIKWAYTGGDEFNETTLDYSTWENSYPWGRNFVGQATLLEYMTDGDNFSLQYNDDIGSGTLKLIARKEDVTELGIPYLSEDHLLNDNLPNLRTWNYTSAMLFSKQTFKYGLFDIKCKLPKGDGFLPAFWLIGQNPDEEIDFFEYKGETPSRFHIDMHCPNECDNFGGWVETSLDFSSDFNNFKGEWSPNFCFWYLNGRQLAGWLGNINSQAHLVMNFSLANKESAFTKDDDNSTIINAGTPFPAEVEIDYIRVWSRYDNCDDEEIFLNNYNQSATDQTSITGKKIEVNSGVLKNKQTLALVARDDIVIKPGFEIEEGSFFSTKITNGCPGPNNKVHNSEFQKKSDEVLEFISDSITKVENKLEVLNVLIYPNPSTGKIHLEYEGEFDGNMEIIVLDNLGKAVFKAENIETSNLDIDLGNLPSGSYFLKGVFGENFVIQKITIE